MKSQAWLMLLSSVLAANAWADPYEAIILGGGKSEEDAEKAIVDFKGADGAKFTPAKDFPKIFSSDDLPGIPKDTYVAVLGFCDRATSAKVIARAIRAIQTGAYSIAVEGRHPDACPGLAPALMSGQDPVEKTAKPVTPEKPRTKPRKSSKRQ
ncbi:MAG TPA: hypothetical protein VM598_12240 [Bdellovibrionota bacterium]|nr:hypothetical protein [Bdellovibrionota bacterium]